MTEILVSEKLIHLRNDRISYVIGLLEGGIPAHLYFGKRVERLNPSSLLRAAWLPGDGSFSMQNCALDHTPQEYPAFGLGEMREGALIIRRENGTRTADLRFASAEVLNGKPKLAGLPATFGEGCKTLRLRLHDELLNLDVVLLYTIFDDCDAIARSVLFENKGGEELNLERCYSLCLDLPDSRYDLITLSGAWARERELVRRPLVMGQQGVGSIRGASSLQTSPFMALLRPETTEEQGEVIAAALVYSGNFTAQAYVDPNRYTRVMMGIHDTGFQWTLDAGATFQTPEAVLVYSAAGLDGMSRQFHRLCADHLVRGRYAHAPRPILLNNWEATYFDFDEEKLLNIARTAAKVGVELFVLDDGWFGHRESDNSSLGDWFVNKRKLPGGLASLAEKVHALGLKFGLWFEPEMISPDSELFRAHPDWCIHVPGRTHIEGRNQLILDLSRPDVCEYIYTALADNLRASGIDYVKWDMNRNFTNVGSALLPPDRQKELPHRYMLGLYGILERLIHDFPHVLFESCSSGGGRFDMGMLHYMPQTWTSDDTDAVCRCRIQYSTSLVFPPFAMGSHVSAVPNHQTGRVAPITTRGNVAMSGCFGYELDLNSLPEEDLKEVEKQVQRVKEHRQLLLYGDFHRLLSPYEGNDTAWITVAPDKSEAILMVTRAMALPGTYPPLIRLRGLDAAKTYRVLETGEIYGGDELMNIGLCVPMPWGDAASVSYTLKAE